MGLTELIQDVPTWVIVWFLMFSIGALILVANTIVDELQPTGVPRPVDVALVAILLIAFLPPISVFGLILWFWNLRIFNPVRRLGRKFLVHTKPGQFIYSFYIEKSNPRRDVCLKVLAHDILNSQIRSARLRAVIEKCAKLEESNANRT